MSDQDLRKGYRVMVSGGLYNMNDDEIEALVTIGSNILKERGKLPPVAEYLQKYNEICEDYIMARNSHYVATEKLDSLNAEYTGKIDKSFLRVDIPAPYGARSYPEYWDEENFDPEAADEYNEMFGWMPSSIC